jgi:hypothetical protein
LGSAACRGRLLPGRRPELLTGCVDDHQETAGAVSVVGQVVADVAVQDPLALELGEGDVIALARCPLTVLAPHRRARRTPQATAGRDHPDEYMTPAEYAHRCRTDDQPELSVRVDRKTGSGHQYRNMMIRPMANRLPQCDSRFILRFGLSRIRAVGT